ncbi:MAG: DUF4391 domain-containing protein [Candidatus Methanomethylophilaceae archaeon]
MSYGLPPSTNVNRQISKDRIIEKAELSGKDRSLFESTVHRVFISNEISPKTVNIPPGNDVKSIFVLKVELRENECDDRIISALFRAIDQKMILILESGIRCRPIVFRKIQIDKGWMFTDDISIVLSGLDLDDVWFDMISAIGDLGFRPGDDIDSLIDLHAKKKVLSAKIERLERSISSDSQPRRQREMYAELKSLKKELEELERR